MSIPPQLWRRLGTQGRAAGKLVLLFGLLLMGVSARAQPGPLFYVEHDWTFSVGGKTFGLTESRWLGDEKYGGGRRTTFWFGVPRLMLKTRTARALELAFGLGVVGLVVLLSRGPNPEPGEAVAPKAQP